MQISPSAITVVFIHGYCENKQVWDPLLPLLPDAFQYRIPDLPGFGEAPLAEIGSMEDYADFLHHQFADQDNLVLIGHSMGGYIAAAYALKYPHKVIGLGFFHSHVFADDEPRRNNRYRAAEFILQNGAEKYIREFVPALFYQPESGEKKQMIDRHYAAVQNTNGAALVQAQQAMAIRPDTTSLLQQIVYPVMFLLGEFDSFITPDAGYKMASLTTIALVEILPGTAHMGMFESNYLSAKTITDFLQVVVQMCNH